jgi:hypothetical protein
LRPLLQRQQLLLVVLLVVAQLLQPPLPPHQPVHLRAQSLLPLQLRLPL